MQQIQQIYQRGLAYCAGASVHSTILKVGVYPKKLSGLPIIPVSAVGMTEWQE